jgi:hypothetical protein
VTKVSCSGNERGCSQSFATKQIDDDKFQRRRRNRKAKRSKSKDHSARSMDEQVKERKIITNLAGSDHSVQIACDEARHQCKPSSSHARLAHIKINCLHCELGKVRDAGRLRVKPRSALPIVKFQPTNHNSPRVRT